MLKGWLTNRHNQEIFMAGLTGENIARLMANEPIPIQIKYGKGKDDWFTICITYGKTDKDLLDEIAKYKVGELRDER
jgi:hypothetical protein